MEFSIDIHTKLNGEIIIEDFSREYKLYLDENADFSYDYYKYSESVTLNNIVKRSIDSITLVDVLLNDHSEYLDSCTFKVKEDGYYIIEHLILPNITWYENLSTDNKQYYNTIYIIDNGKLYKELEGNLVECTVKEVLERNIEGTTIKKCKIEVFFTGNLLQCYINYCKQLFDSLLDSCAPENKDLTYIRDFIWMTLNVIDYLIGFKLYLEAERILSMFNKCGGYCKSAKSHPRINCGCS